MAESEKKKVVPFSVRFDPDLFDDLESALNKIPRGQRPTKDKFIQDAVAASIGKPAATTPIVNLDDPAKGEIKYAHVSPEKWPWVKKLLRILDSKTQLRAAIEKNLDGFDFSLDAVEELAQLKASRNEQQPNRTAPAGDDLKEGTERLGKAIAGTGRALEGTPKVKKVVGGEKA